MRLIKFVLICGLIWSAYWYGVAYILREGVTRWFANQETQGWQADFAALNSSGYPLRHFTTLEAPALADPVSGLAWQADWLHLVTPAFWPGRIDLEFPPTPQRLSVFDRNMVIEARSMRGQFHLRPELALSVARVALTSGPWIYITPLGDVIGGRSFHGRANQSHQPERYDIALTIEDFEPGRAVMRKAKETHGLPERLSELSLQGSVLFDKAWDRETLTQGKPQPRSITLDHAVASWGALSLRLSGDIAIDDAGRPDGSIAISAENWRSVLDLAASMGMVAPASLPALTRILETLSLGSGSSDRLDATLRMESGIITLGPIPLGSFRLFFAR